MTQPVDPRLMGVYEPPPGQVTIPPVEITGSPGGSPYSPPGPFDPGLYGPPGPGDLAAFPTFQPAYPGAVPPNGSFAANYGGMSPDQAQRPMMGPTAAPGPVAAPPANHLITSSQSANGGTWYGAQLRPVGGEPQAPLGEPLDPISWRAKREAMARGGSQADEPLPLDPVSWRARREVMARPAESPMTTRDIALAQGDALKILYENLGKMRDKLFAGPQTKVASTEPANEAK